MNDETNPRKEPDDDGRRQFLTPKQAAAVLDVDTKTIARWEQARKIGSIKTVGRHRRYPRSEIYALLQSMQSKRSGSDRSS
jgi:excisionase family DNA binding protein